LLRAAALGTLARVKPVLYHLTYSPWSEKARWALDHHGIDHVAREHLIMLGEPKLRLAAGSLTKRASVPLLVVDGERISDSYEIALWAERHGRGAPLVPHGCEAEVKAWDERSQAVCASGRARTSIRTLEDDTALLEAAPPLLRPLGPVTVLTARSGAKFLAEKYGYALDDVAMENARRKMEEHLDALRDALSGRDTILDEGFSLADISMAVSLQFVTPVANEYISLLPATRQAWTDREIAARYPDLLDWRDRLYAEHRRN
jgi:glutathione S-transferase